MPDQFGNPTVMEQYNQQFSQALTPMLEGQPGQSPLTQAAVQAFQQNTLPIMGVSAWLNCWLYSSRGVELPSASGTVSPPHAEALPKSAIET